MNDRVRQHQRYKATNDHAWLLEASGDDPLREESRQSRFAISNGFLGVRADRAATNGERANWPSGTLIAGLFDRSFEADAVPRLLSGPNWLQVRLSSRGSLVTRPARAETHQMHLDMKRGLLLVDHDYVDDVCALRVHELRLVSAAQRAIGLQACRIEVLEGNFDFQLEALFGPADVALIMDLEEPGQIVWHTRSGKALMMAAQTCVSIAGAIVPQAASAHLGGSWAGRASEGQVVELERQVAFCRSGLGMEGIPATASADLRAAVAQSSDDVLLDHEAAWAERWLACDIEIEGDPAAQKALRFAAFHLNGAANPDDGRVSIAARALTGLDYAGHVFWDTDIFLLPFYCLTWPKAARALLMYRFHTLDGARAKAARLGWKGALYAWESADTGEDVTPAHSVAPDRRVTDILCGTQEQHISADVAYAVWQYWTVTGNEAFLLNAGAEILLETARFWVSRAVPEGDGQRHIRRVIGPDEYHETIDDNAFTNVMARWNIERGVEVAELLRSHWPDRWASLCEHLSLDDTEIGRWPEAARAIVTGKDAHSGLFEQFEGYFALEPIDLAHYAGRSVPIDVVLGHERTAKSQVIKQADVVALVALLPEAFTAGDDVFNFAFYEPRCSHGSSLSTAMHGLVAARLGQADKALDYFHRTAAIDLCNDKAAIGGGIHIAAQGGLWMMAVLGFAGVSFQPDGISLKPQLPPCWSSMRFALQWHDRSLRIAINAVDRSVSVHLERGEPMAIHIDDVRYWLQPGGTRQITMKATPLNRRFVAGVS
ncbi:glycosyl hydrolase family 65 protein [Brevundimonas sp.]